jgi:hypothetical protein
MTGDKKPEFSDKELKVHIRHILLHEFLRGAKPSVVIKELYELYGDEVMCQRTIKRWFVRFGKGDFSLLDKPKLGKRKLDKDRFTEFIANNYSISNKDLADAFDVSPETIRKYRAMWCQDSKGEEGPQREPVIDTNNTIGGADDANIAIVTPDTVIGVDTSNAATAADTINTIIDTDTANTVTSDTAISTNITDPATVTDTINTAISPENDITAASDINNAATSADTTNVAAHTVITTDSSNTVTAADTANTSSVADTAVIATTTSTELDNVFNPIDIKVESILPSIDDYKENDSLLTLPKDATTVSSETDTTANKNTTTLLGNDSLNDGTE